MPQGLIKTPNGSLILNFVGGITKTITDSAKVLAITEAMAKGASDSTLLEIIDPSLLITKHASGLFGVKDGCVFINNEPLPDALSVRILDFANSNLPFQPLLKFWENCKLNPDPRAKTDLYKFLEHNGHPITAEGHFIAYRAIRENFMDKYTGTISNKVGEIVRKKREECNPDPNVTCSHGLHAASYDYARNVYGSGTDILIEVKVDPRHVVAVPIDYNNQKLRCCEYEVIAINVDGIISRPCYDPENIPSDDDTYGDDSDEDDDLDNEEICNDDCTKCGYQGCCALPPEKRLKENINDNWKTQTRDSKGRFLPKN
jgi:hypothetical protein